MKIVVLLFFIETLNEAIEVINDLGFLKYDFPFATLT